MAGAREAKVSGTDKTLIGAGAAAAVVLAGYLGLCAWAYGQDTAMPNVSAAGVDVSGMTAQQAEQAVEAELSTEGMTMSRAVELRCGEYVGYLGSESFRVDAASVAQAAVERGRENFLTAGGSYLAHLLGGGGEVRAQQCSLTPGGEEELERQIRAAEGELGIVPGSENDYLLDVEDAKLTLVKGHTIRCVDRQAAREAVENAFLTILRQGAVPDGKPTMVNLISTQQDPVPPDFQAIHDEVYCQAKDARLVKETGAVEEGTAGVDFGVLMAQAAYNAADEGGTVVIPLTVTRPAISKEELERVLFRDLLGEGTTKVTGSANRKSNVKLAASACNGVILLPGEVFSYNGTTGSRTADKGYLPAPVYVGSKSEQEVGGGICQPSSTIYFAVLHTPLEIVERHNHTFSTGYVTDGMDATVYYGSLDFQFKNSTGYPVKIVTESYDKNGARYLTVKLYGTNADGRYAKSESTVYDLVYPTTSYVADSSVPQGTLVLDREQYSYVGKKAHTYRSIYEADGTLAEKQDLGISSYKMRPNLYHYNPLDGEPSTWVNGRPPAAARTAKPEIVDETAVPDEAAVPDEIQEPPPEYPGVPVDLPAVTGTESESTGGDAQAEEQNDA